MNNVLLHNITYYGEGQHFENYPFKSFSFYLKFERLNYIKFPVTHLAYSKTKSNKSFVRQYNKNYD